MQADRLNLPTQRIHIIVDQHSFIVYALRIQPQRTGASYYMSLINEK